MVIVAQYEAAVLYAIFGKIIAPFRMVFYPCFGAGSKQKYLFCRKGKRMLRRYDAFFVVMAGV